MATLYKLTDENMLTRAGMYNETRWEIGVPVSAKEKGLTLCTARVIHAYVDPLLAVLLNPIHAEFRNPRLFEAEGEVVANDFGLKVGVKTLTLLRELPVPKVSTHQRVRFAILCAAEVTAALRWREWADGWLSGRNRTEGAAWAAWAAVERTAWAAADRAALAAWAATDRAAWASEQAAWAAAAAAVTAATAEQSKTVDLIALAKKAMED